MAKIFLRNRAFRNKPNNNFAASVKAHFYNKQAKLIGVCKLVEKNSRIFAKAFFAS